MTRLLNEASEGRAGAVDDLFPIVYEELQRLARLVRGRGAGDTLNTTALVHEAYFKLARTKTVDWAGRQHFFRVASKAMRQVIVEDARRRHTAKRGGGEHRVTLNENLHGDQATDDEILALHEALVRLEAIDPRQAAVVEVRYFSGLSIDEAADTLGVSAPTVNRAWRNARLWLARELAA